MRFRRLVPYFRVNDMHRSIAFYRDALGFQTVETIGEGEDLFWAQLQRDEVAIMVSLGFIEILGTKGAEVTDPALHQEGRTNDHGTTRDRLGNEYLNVSTYLYVDDADELYGQILRAGYATLTEPEDQEYGIRSFHVEDPDGYVLSIAHLLGDD